MRVAIAFFLFVTLGSGAAQAQDGGAPAADAGVAMPSDAGLPPADAALEPPPPEPPPQPEPPPPAAIPPVAPPIEPAEVPPVEPEPQRQPLRYGERPLITPHDTLRIDALLVHSHIEAVPLPPPATTPDDDNFLTLIAGFAYGAADEFEFGAVVFPLTLSPGTELLQPSGHLAARFFASDQVEVGARATMFLPVSEENPFAMTVAIEALIRAGIFRLDLRLLAGLSNQEPVSSRVSLGVVGTFQVSERIFLGAQTGGDLYDGENLDVPLGVFAGVSLPGQRGPAGDLRLGLFLPEMRDGFDAYSIGFGGSFFAYFGGETGVTASSARSNRRSNSWK